MCPSCFFKALSYYLSKIEMGQDIENYQKQIGEKELVMGIIIRGINFGGIFASAASTGIFCEGWGTPQEKLLRYVPGYDLTGVTKITKTFTIDGRMAKREERGRGKGNMVLDPETYKPVDFFPDCIKVRLFHGELLNAVSLSGPPFEEVIKSGKLQKITEPFGISFMPVGSTEEERFEENEKFTRILEKRLPEFCAPFFIERNDSCPNTDRCHISSTKETKKHLEATSVLGVVQGVKINALTSVEALILLVSSGYCDFIDLPNTVPYGQLPDKIDWEKKFGKKSPLAKYGGGGYSGRENFKEAISKIKEARAAGIDIPIICGGVYNREDVWTAKFAGANAVAMYRVMKLRSWRVNGIKKEANRVFGKGG